MQNKVILITAQINKDIIFCKRFFICVVEFHFINISWEIYPEIFTLRNTNVWKEFPWYIYKGNCQNTIFLSSLYYMKKMHFFYKKNNKSNNWGVFFFSDPRFWGKGLEIIKISEICLQQNSIFNYILKIYDLNKIKSANFSVFVLQCMYKEKMPTIEP